MKTLFALRKQIREFDLVILDELGCTPTGEDDMNGQPSEQMTLRS